jgi:catechol 2,3-dioxygenase-like lactoylglutathione lyase family enzyme
MEIDHVVLWVESPKRALAFYVDVLGLAPERAEDYVAGRTSFPSVRLNETAILDLMERDKIAAVRAFTGGGEASGGTPINHVCLAMTAAEYAALTVRLKAAGVALKSAGERPFGARGHARESVYFQDPDGNVVEIRHYDEAP